ncbi:hypothetical protein Sango_1596600 [Sesamum angolense]|uniref:Uncharacterized protein n=1 Tax=Sesamum angolense TaxID=2727404 RepID=A0AAE1WQD7_9LAMI|nr:hypothetical protein Sango_1596600 [Sesamum angolense]
MSVYYIYDPFEQKIFILRNAVFLKNGFPVDNQWDEVVLEESSETPQQNDVTSFGPSIPTYGVPVLRRSTRESQPPETYRFIGLTSQLDNVPMMPIGCKLLYKRKLGADGEVTAFETRIVAKGNRSRRMLRLAQSSYIEKVLKRFKMINSERGDLLMRHQIKLSKKQSPKTDEELKRMLDIPYASAVGSIQYVVQCTKPYNHLCFKYAKQISGMRKGGALECGQDYTYVLEKG